MLEKSLKRPLSEGNEQENEVPFMSKNALKKLKQWGTVHKKKGECCRTGTFKEMDYQG